MGADVLLNADLFLGICLPHGNVVALYVSERLKLLNPLPHNKF